MTKKGYRDLLLVCLFFQIISAVAQMYPVQKYSVQQGLSHSNVFRVFQDKKGFLWFCTSYGLSKFDGRSFQNFTSGSGLNNNAVISLMQLSDGKIWINNFGGVNILKNDTVLKPGFTGKPSYSKCIYSAEYDGAFWLVTLDKEHELFKIKSGVAEQVIVTDPSGKRVQFTRIDPDTTLGLILCSSAGLFTYKKGSGIKKIFGDIISERVFDVERDKYGHYWVGLEDRILEIGGGKLLFSYKLPNKSAVSRLMADSENNIWAAIPRLGVVVISQHTGRVITDRLGIGKIIINDIFEDAQKNIWIATHGDGVYRISSLNITHYPVEKNKLNVYAKAMLKDRGAMFIGTFGTVSRIQDATLTSVPSQMLRSTDCIYFLAKVAPDKILIGLPTGMIVKNLGQNDSEKLFPGNGAIAICRDHAGKIWIGNFNSLSYFKDSTLKAYAPFPLLTDRRVNSIHEDSDSTLWLGTNAGIYAVSRKRDSCVAISIPFALNVYVNQIYEDKQKRLWIATDEGLFMRIHGKWRAFTKAKGLSHNKCNTLCEDDTGNIWIGTLKGLNRIQADGSKIAEIGMGIFPNEILSIAKDSGKIFIGTVNGVSTIDLNERAYEPGSLPLYITAASLSDTRFLYPKHLNVAYDAGKLVIEYIALHFTYPEGVEYRYCIRQGKAQKWNLTTNTRIEIPMLHPGNYDFNIQARISHGSWSPPVKLQISVAGPLWKTPWFLACAVLLGLAFVFLTLRWWFEKKTEKKIKTQMVHNQINHLRQQALLALISPHFIFNCMNSIQYYLHQNNATLANKYLARFGKLIRLTMEQAQETFILLSEELQRLELYLSLEKLRCREKLSFNFEIEPGLDIEALLIPNMILQPYVENAIWHGIMHSENDGLIEIQVKTLDASYFKITISDNGQGIKNISEPADSHKSYGLKLTRERFALLEALSKKKHRIVIFDREELGLSGTQVEIILPFKSSGPLLV